MTVTSMLGDAEMISAAARCASTRERLTAEARHRER
jgi:hypothetical protein